MRLSDDVCNDLLAGIMEQDKTRRGTQRSYNRAFKTRILRECAQPGANVSQVARAHGMNTNNIYRWRRQLARGELQLVGGAEFIPVDLAPSARNSEAKPVTQPMTAPAAPIEVRLQRGPVQVTVRWPVCAGRDCAAFLLELLR